MRRVSFTHSGNEGMFYTMTLRKKILGVVLYFFSTPMLICNIEGKKPSTVTKTEERGLDHGFGDDVKAR